MIRHRRRAADADAADDDAAASATTLPTEQRISSSPDCIPHTVC